ncbi:hypothetical protein HMPREF1210_00516 [Paenisporosarcina sp. HGH0030]|uniref:DUF4179 domain-containing protein n=1 Tax=Paenisporosarcina sp. HGH0030 TaxID=1078085 RepID=UPI00034EC776|nr:DUF4179 domain-containing protein [Paenisporosarcina sp. HGH0030]EPD53693.1 hypothetical protein HMPREF1210_00516 [Paenisporosarcina sp. HGH0030]
MEKKSFREVYEKIEVPKDGVLNAIKSGKERASHNGPENKKSTKVVWFSVAAATIFISSSFISPSISHVMAEVPFLGNVYTAFSDAVGRDLQSQDLITELNQTYSYKGVDVSITNAYYDGAVVGVAFSVKGNVKTEEDGSVQGFYEIFDGKDGISDSKEIVYMEPSENGYIGHIQLSYPKTELPSETSFPLEFKRIGTKEGSWRFDVPINQLPYETVYVDKGTNEEDAEINVHFDSIIEGKASTAINYTATFPIQGKHDQVRLEAYDDQGKEINISIDGIDLETVKENNRIIVKGRSIIPQSIKGETSYIEVLPKVALSEPDHFIKLDEATPVEVNAERQDLAVGIENIIKTDKSITFDFQINNGNNMNQHFTVFSNFARNDVTLVKESEKEIYEKPIKHSVEVINKDNLRFTSTFDISEIDDFNLDDYVIRVNMGSLSANIPVELEKVKIDLN